MQVTTDSAAQGRQGGRLAVGLARHRDDIEAAQRLRWQVFGEELGARLASRVPGRDEDHFDPWCEHLVVRDEATGEVVGTYRILTAERAQRLGAFYADTEFDLTRLRLVRPALCEIGRACVDRRYRGGAALTLLWQGIATFMRERGYGYLIGCASIGMGDGGLNAVRVWHRLAPRYLAPIEHRVVPRHPLIPREGDGRADDGGTADVPPLLRGYLRLGAWIGGEPAWDPDFNTADLFVFLPLARVDARYARHALRAAA